MENNKLPEKLIDDFIMGLLNKEDDRSFRQRLQKEPALAKEVTLRREMISGLEAFGRKDLKEELKNIHEEVIGQNKQPAKRRSLFPYIAAAASVLVLFVALSWFMNRNTVQSPQQLYASYFEPYDISGMPREGNEELIIRMKQLYANGKYREALPLLEAEREKPSARYSELSLAIGIAYLEEDQPEKAAQNFDLIIINEDFTFEDEWRWYSALALLKLGNIERAKDLLEPLVKNKGADHQKEARELFVKLHDL